MWARGTFRRIILAADKYYENMGKTAKERKALMAQMRNYRYHKAPFDMSFDNNECPSTWWFSLEDSFPEHEDHICQLANKLFSITPHAAGCERIWSTLGWYYGKRRTRLSLGKIENMQKLSAFYLANSKIELPYFSINKTVENLHEILYNADLYDDENLEEELTNEDIEDFTFPEEELLGIKKLLNIDAADFTNSLGEIIGDTFNLFEKDDDVAQDNNSVEEEWDPEKEADAILDNEFEY